MSDTFFSASPHWTWFIIPYFFVGGIAGGAYFHAALLEWLGRPEDRPVIRTGYGVAFWGAIISGALLTFDLGRPLRFWHMLFQSENFPSLMFKSWSPISFGAWAILLFGACATLSMIGVRVEEGRVRAPAAQWLRSGTLPAKVIAAVGGPLLGFFVAGYTGVLLSVTNRPIWADSPWLGALFLASATSTGAAVLALLAPKRGAETSLRWLSSADTKALVSELILLVVFVISLGSVAKVWLSFWGLLLLVGVVWTGILWPLVLHSRPAGSGGGTGFRNPALMVLLGGFLLRLTVLLASNSIALHGVATGGN